jgi:hypothetical protein
MVAIRPLMPVSVRSIPSCLELILNWLAMRESKLMDGFRRITFPGRLRLENHRGDLSGGTMAAGCGKGRVA